MKVVDSEVGVWPPVDGQLQRALKNLRKVLRSVQSARRRGAFCHKQSARRHRFDKKTTSLATPRNPSELVLSQEVPRSEVQNSHMKRVFAILLAIVVPLQSAMGAIVPITGMSRQACEQLVTRMEHQGQHGAAADQSVCECNEAAPGGAHGMMGNHACPHLGMATVATAPTNLQLVEAARALPETTHASFISIVLEVPSPPPTRVA